MDEILDLTKYDITLENTGIGVEYISLYDIDRVEQDKIFLKKKLQFIDDDSINGGTVMCCNDEFDFSLTERPNDSSAYVLFTKKI